MVPFFLAFAQTFLSAWNAPVAPPEAALLGVVNPTHPQDLKQNFLPEVIFPAPPGKENSLQCSWSPWQEGTSTVTFITLDWS